MQEPLTSWQTESGTERFKVPSSPISLQAANLHDVTSSETFNGDGYHNNAKDLLMSGVLAYMCLSTPRKDRVFDAMLQDIDRAQPGGPGSKDRAGMAARTAHQLVTNLCSNGSCEQFRISYVQYPPQTSLDLSRCALTSYTHAVPECKNRAFAKISQELLNKIHSGSTIKDWDLEFFPALVSYLQATSICTHASDPGNQEARDDKVVIEELTTLYGGCMIS